MTLVRINPLFFDLDREVEALNRLVGRTLVSRSVSPQTVQDVFPALELENREAAVILRAELPGFDTKDLTIEVMADRVTLRGERQAENSSSENGMLHSEFRYGSFERTVRLPAKVQNTTVQADYRDGILTLTLPKQQEAVNRAVKLDLSQLSSVAEPRNKAVDAAIAQ
jgi:HSP20 family protein